MGHDLPREKNGLRYVRRDGCGYDFVDSWSSSLIMQIDIDFSIFDSPSTAYGNVTGSVEVQSPPSVGDVVDLCAAGHPLKSVGGFSGKLKVISVTQVDDSGDLLYGLEDVVVTSRVEAQELGKQLETELGLFCVDYER